MNQIAPPEGYSDDIYNVEEVNCLFVPLHDTALLVPMSAVAEVVQTVKIEEQMDAPVWFDGWLEWRQKRVPLISFEAIGNGNRQGVSENATALVINTLSQDKGLSYYALQAQGFSHLVRVAEDDPLQQLDGPSSLPHVLMDIDLDGRILQVPDLESLEAYLAESLQQVVKKG